MILAKTVKGWTLGGAIEGRNVTHQAKKLSEEELKKFRDTLELPIKDEDLDEGVPPYYHPGEDSEEVQYMVERRRELGGSVPSRRPHVGAASSFPRRLCTTSSTTGPRDNPWPPRWRSFGCCVS